MGRAETERVLGMENRRGLRTKLNGWRSMMCDRSEFCKLFTILFFFAGWGFWVKVCDDFVCLFWLWRNVERRRKKRKRRTRRSRRRWGHVPVFRGAFHGEVCWGFGEDAFMRFGSLLCWAWSMCFFRVSVDPVEEDRGERRRRRRRQERKRYGSWISGHVVVGRGQNRRGAKKRDESTGGALRCARRDRSRIVDHTEECCIAEEPMSSEREQLLHTRCSSHHTPVQWTSGYSKISSQSSATAKPEGILIPYRGVCKFCSWTFTRPCLPLAFLFHFRFSWCLLHGALELHISDCKKVAWNILHPGCQPCHSWNYPVCHNTWTWWIKHQGSNILSQFANPRFTILQVELSGNQILCYSSGAPVSSIASFWCRAYCKMLAATVAVTTAAVVSPCAFRPE